jgi:hypothetical protein
MAREHRSEGPSSSTCETPPIQMNQSGVDTHPFDDCGADQRGRMPVGKVQQVEVAGGGDSSSDFVVNIPPPRVVPSARW